MRSLEDLRDFEDVAERVRAGLEPVRYRRPVEAIRPHRPAAPRLAAVAVAVVLAVAIALLPRGQVPAIAWEPEPAPVTAADADRARAACAGTAGAGTAGEDVLPPLVLLDLRGALGIATFADEHVVATCLLHTGEEAWRGEDYLRYEQSPLGTRTILVETVSTFELDGETVTLVTGSASAGIASVTVRIPGLEQAQAKLNAGQFSIWFPHGIDGVTVHARSAGGSELERLRLEDMA